MDCNKTTNFFSELKRLCDSRTWCEAGTENKEQCPLFDVCVWRLGIVCNEDVKRAIEILQKWSNEHPKKTYAQDFLEKFPDAPKFKSFNNGGCPSACRTRIYGGKCPEIECAECWNEPMEE